MGFKTWFGASQPSSRQTGKAKFNLFGKQTKASFKRSIKKLNYQDRQKAFSLDKEIRSARKGTVSHDQYLKTAYKKYGTVFKRRLKERVFTAYEPENKMSERRKRMNIYYARKSREEGAKAGNRQSGLANQIDHSQVRATASRVGATAGQVEHKTDISGGIDRPVLKV